MQLQNWQASEIFKQVVEAAPNGMIMANQSGQIVLVNAQTAKLFGYTRDEMLKLEVESLVPERFRGRHPALRNDYFGNPQVRAMGAGRDLFGLRKDGSEFPVEIGLNPISSGGEMYVLASVIDITQRKRAEEMFRRVVEAAPNGMLMVNSEGKIVLTNRQAERMFCYERDELLLNSIEMLVPVRFRSGHPAHRGAFFSNPHVRAMGAGRDLFGLRKDFSEFPVEIGLNPISTEDGLFVLASVIDITERKRDEQLLRASLHEKEVLLKEIHHRVKNNLAVVSSLFYLQSTYVKDASVAAVFQESQDRVRAMSLVHETLYRSQNLAGIDLGDYAHTLLENLMSTYRPAPEKIALKWETEPVLLSIEEAIPCGLILNELIVNCMKHAFPDDVRGSIQIGLKTENESCVVFVRDTGIGLPQDLDFQSARTLGLRLIRSLSGQLNGNLNLSGWFQGPKSDLSFPRTKVEFNSMPVESLNSSRILVVEDESLIAEEIKDRLERMGVNVVAMVASGEDAVLRAGELHPNIILMDIRLRGSIDGIEAAQRIATLHQIPVVYLTAHADDATLARAKSTAPYGYLLKPFAERDLRIVLEMALYKHSTEAKLHQSRELYATTLAGIIEGVIAADEKSCVTFMNPAAERMTQWTAKEATGRSVQEIANVVNSKTHENIHGMTGQVLVTGEPLFLDDVLLVSRNGNEMPVCDSISPIRDAENCVKGVVLVLRDLTEQNRLNQALRDSDLRMQRMQKMDAIGRLAGGIAHDVGNMMMIVRGNGELLLEKLPMNDSTRTRVEGMLHAADRSSALARQLLAFSRKQSFTTIPVDLNEAVEGMRPMLQALLGPEVHIEADLNRLIAPILADRAQIEQILMNLSINSRDAMPAGGTLKFETTKLTVKDESPGLSGIKPGQYSVLSVTDTGVGMSDEVKAHLFEPFFTTKGVGKGTGMGLATVFGIVAQFNGHIDISSKLEHGTSVRIHFPAIDQGVMNGLASDHVNAIPSATILLVEDEPELRELVIEFLKSQNYRVIAAGDGEEALDLAQKEAGSIDLLLTDAMMPRMSGVMLAEKLGTLRPNTKVIFMSGYTEDCLTDRNSLKIGMAFIQKPFSKGDLLRIVADMIRVNK